MRNLLKNSDKTFKIFLWNSENGRFNGPENYFSGKK